MKNQLLRQRIRAAACLAGMLFPLILISAGCQPLETWPGSDIVTPSGVETATQQTTTASSQPTLTQTGTTTASPTTTMTESTQKPTDQPTETTQTAPPTTVTQQTWDDLEQLDNSKTGWYYVPAAPLDADQPATLPQSVLDLIRDRSVLWQIPDGDSIGPQLYLTMDAGYEYNNLTDTILDVVRDKQVPVTFFITGSYLANNPERVRRMAAEGHQVANHTQKHPNLVDLLETQGPQAVLDELTAVSATFAELTGREMPLLMRPPEGSYSPRLLALLQAAGYQTVFWSFAYRDWLTDDQPDQGEALQKILSQLHPGSVLLLHTVSETNAAILPDLIDSARARGYTFSLLP